MRLKLLPLDGVPKLSQALLQLDVFATKRRIRRESDVEEQNKLRWQLAIRATLRHFAISADLRAATRWASSNFEVPAIQLGAYVENRLNDNRAFKMSAPDLTWHMMASQHRLGRVEEGIEQLRGDLRRSGSLQRNVATNVVANLIAGAIAYLAGVAAGYFRASPALVILALLLVVPALISVVMVVLGGYKYITSGGDSSNVAAAKNTMIYGFAIVLAAPALWTPARLGYSFSVQKNFEAPALLTNWLLLAVVLALVARLATPARYRWITYLVALLAGIFAAVLLVGLLVGYIWR